MIIFLLNKFPNLKKLFVVKVNGSRILMDQWGDVQMIGLTYVEKFEEITYLNINMYSLKDMSYLKKVDNLSVSGFDERDTSIINKLEVKNLIMATIEDYFDNLNFLYNLNKDLIKLELHGFSVSSNANLNYLANKEYLKSFTLTA